jgi:hypothetical protein
VTADAMLDVNGLSERVTPDLFALYQRILQQVLDRLAREYAVGDAADKPPEETIAIAVGNRLAQMLSGGNGSAASEWSATSDEPEVSPPYDELLDRDVALAGALGACDCWGEQANCPICRGAGRPGWALPDRRLFATYVRPALTALPTRHAGPAGARPQTEHEKKEATDV